MLETALKLVDRMLGLTDLAPVHELWNKLDWTLEEMLGATGIDAARHARMAGLTASLRAVASEFSQNLLNYRRGGPLHGDWRGFAERGLVRMKDELLALREFFVEEADFLESACFRAQLGKLGVADPGRLFMELHEAGAISERTWVVLMAHPDPWRRVLRDRELSGQLTRIAGWFLDLQETRVGRVDDVRKTG